MEEFVDGLKKILFLDLIDKDKFWLVLKEGIVAFLRTSQDVCLRI